MNSDPSLLHGLLFSTANTHGSRPALIYAGESLSYDELADRIHRLGAALVALGLERSARVGIYLEKRFEMVIGCIGAAAAGGVFVPINPILKPDQVAYIMRDCNVRVLITSPERLSVLVEALAQCPDLQHVIVVDSAAMPASISVNTHLWSEMMQSRPNRVHRVIDADMLAILYTSGSTGKPKGVVLSHRNMVAGARSVAQYLENRPDDSLVAALPLSFDAGFSQLTTAFSVGARVVLLNYLMPRDVVNTLVKERITGITAVPPLYIQMSQLDWPATVTDHLRYFANTGGRMPFETLKRLRTLLPRTKPYLMYGLTEAFRSTYLPPEEVDRRPDSIGKAIPNAEVLVLREDGTHCAPDEPGELVHRGALVGMGYWNDREKTAERYKPVPGRESGLVFPEMAVFSGDNVRMDEDGFLYFIGRRDEMIKTSGYRVSPTEIEEILYATRMVGELAAFGVSHPTLGQAIVVIATPKPGESLDSAALLTACRDRLPAYMIPARIDVRDGPLPRNPNGKIDRKLLSGDYQDMFEKVSA